MRNIRVVKLEGFRGYSYGHDPIRTRFGYQDGIVESFLDEKLGKKTRATINLSAKPSATSMAVTMVPCKNVGYSDSYEVTSPRVLKGHKFCKAGVAEYLGAKAAQQKRIKVYVKL